jgi:hypothetical protein
MDLNAVLASLTEAEPELRDPSVARQVIVRLRKGQPPTHGVLALTPNGSAIEQTLRDLLEQQGSTWEPGGKAEPINLFIRGNPGAGKTHLLRYFEAAQATLGAATAWLETSDCQGKLHVVTAWLPSLLHKMLIPFDGHRVSYQRALEMWREGHASAEVNDWVRRHKTQKKMGEFAQDLALYLADGDDDARGRLLGLDLAHSSPWHQQRALWRLAALSDLLSALGVPRLVLLIDQLETMERLVRDIRSRIRIYTFWYETFMRSLVSTVTLWSVVPDQFSVLERDLYKGRLEDYRDRDFIPSFIDAFKSDPWPHVEVPSLSSDDCERMARNVVALFVHGHGLHKDRRATRIARMDQQIASLIENEFRNDDPRKVTSGLVNWLNGKLLVEPEAV